MGWWVWVDGQEAGGRRGSSFDEVGRALWSARARARSSSDLGRPKADQPLLATLVLVLLHPASTLELAVIMADRDEPVRTRAQS